MHTSKVLNSFDLTTCPLVILCEKPNKIWSSMSNGDICLFDIHGNGQYGRYLYFSRKNCRTSKV